MDYKIDYLRLTIIPPSPEIDVSEITRFLFRLFRLDSVKSEFLALHGGRFYETRYTYRNIINIKVPAQYCVDVQGFCVEFSGQGVSWYEDYIEQNYRRFCGWREILSDFFSFGDMGFDCRCNRIDIAFDDVVYNASRKPYLELIKIENALKRGEYTSLFRKNTTRSPIENKVEAYKTTARNRNGAEGTTINIGNRKSDVFVRFYDKMAEQMLKDGYDEKITHWVRMEYEFKNTRALSICDALICMNEDEFSSYMAKVINKYLSFKVTRNEKNSANYCRCAQKRWWTRTIGTVEKMRLSRNLAYKNRYVHSLQYLRTKIYPTIYAILQCQTLDEFVVDVANEGVERQNKNHKDIINDFIKCRDDERLRGYEVHKVTFDDYEKILEQFARSKAKNDIKRLRERLSDVGDVEKVFSVYDKTSAEGLGANLESYGEYITDYKTLKMREYEQLQFFA